MKVEEYQSQIQREQLSVHQAMGLVQYIIVYIHNPYEKAMRVENEKLQSGPLGVLRSCLHVYTRDCRQAWHKLSVNRLAALFVKWVRTPQHIKSVHPLIPSSTNQSGRAPTELTGEICTCSSQ